MSRGVPSSDTAAASSVAALAGGSKAQARLGGSSGTRGCVHGWLAEAQLALRRRVDVITDNRRTCPAELRVPGWSGASDCPQQKRCGRLAQMQSGCPPLTHQGGMSSSGGKTIRKLLLTAVSRQRWPRRPLLRTRVPWIAIISMCTRDPKGGHLFCPEGKQIYVLLWIAKTTPRFS